MRAQGLGTRLAAWRPGKLLFTGDIGGLDGFISATVHRFSIESRRSGPWDAPEITAAFDLSRVEIQHGPDDGALWRTLNGWVKENPRDHKWPPDVVALLELARRHPEEYEELREGEAVIRALGG